MSWNRVALAAVSALMTAFSVWRLKVCLGRGQVFNVLAWTLICMLFGYTLLMIAVG